MKLTKTNIILIFIVLVGTVLRFYNILNLHFTNDELSGLNRTNFNSFNELINKGVMPDGHPALIQVFLYFYTKLFGFGDFIIKLPFLIMGVLSIILSYKVTKRFFTQTAGLVTASFIAVLQYTVMYSQIARPYSSGLFLILLSVYFLQAFIFDERLKKSSIIGFILISTLSAYNHYFSLLTILLIGILGLFLVKKENLKIYFISGLSIILLFVPHIKISLYQLSLGGLSWLGKPTPSFILNYLEYSLNYCWLLFFIIGIIFIAGFVYNNGYKTIRFSIFTFLIFILPIIIGYTYSVKISPILQFSVLIFSFPFLLMFLSSFIKELNYKANIALVASILLVGILSLTVTRKHYTVTYNSAFYKVAKNLTYDINKYGNNNVSEVFILNGNFYVNKYLHEFEVDTTKLNANYQVGGFNINEVKNFIKTSNTNYFALAAINGISYLYLIDIIKNDYPYLVKATDTYFLFSKNKQKLNKFTSIIDTVYSSKTNFINTSKDWKFNSQSVITDSTTHEKYYYYNTEEWGVSIDLNLDSTLSNKNNIVITKAVVQSEKDNANILLVSELSNSDSLLHWSSNSIYDYSKSSLNKTTIYNTKPLQDIEIGKNGSLKIFLWNNNKNKIKVFSIELTILQGFNNPYGQFMPFE